MHYVLYIASLCQIYIIYKQLITILATDSQMRSVIKNKQNLANQVKRRFHFDPKTLSNKPRAITKTRTSQQTINPQKGQGEFSSVKEKNQFNDSSWLAKLVNGIQENSSCPQSKDTDQIIVTEISEPYNKDMLYPTKKNSANSVSLADRKNSTKLQKSFERKKSVSTVFSDHGLKRSYSKFVRPKATDKLQKEYIPEMKNVETKKFHYEMEPVSNNLDALESNELVRNDDDGKNRHRQSIQKNSLISYSSIGLEDIEEQIFVLKEPESQMKPKIQASKTVAINTEKNEKKSLEKSKKVYQKPKKSVNKFSEQTIKNKSLANKKSSSQSKLKYKYEIDDIASDKGSEISSKFMQSQLKVSDKKRTIKNKDISSVHKDPSFEYLNRSRGEKKKTEEQCSNEFLKKSWMLQERTPIASFVEKRNEVFEKAKQEDGHIQIEQITPVPLNFQEEKPKRVGKIKKNKTMSDYRKNQQTGIEKTSYHQDQVSPLKYDYSALALTPTESAVTIKKSRRPSQNQLVQILSKKSYENIRNIDDIKLNHPPHKRGQSLIHESEMQHHKREDNETQSIKNIFSKLNIHNEETVHGGNCYQANLTEQERYEVGPLISKMKYMNKRYSEMEFIRECRRINIEASNCSIKKNTSEDYPHNGRVLKNIKTRQFPERYSINEANLHQKRQIAVASNRKYSYFDNNDKENRNVQTDVKQNIYSKRQLSYASQEKQIKKRSFSPLFPQNRLTNNNSQNTTPNKSPYLQMPSFPDLAGQFRQYEQNRRKNSSNGKNSTVKNIGDMIDSLNSKINCYIENHHLEDTFRKFKLDFVHLRENMYS